MFKEVKLFFDEDKKFFSIDAWRTLSPNEEGIVVAKVYGDRIEYRKVIYENLEEVKNAVKVAEMSLQQMRKEGVEI